LLQDKALPECHNARHKTQVARMARQTLPLVKKLPLLGLVLFLVVAFFGALRVENHLLRQLPPAPARWNQDNFSDAVRAIDEEFHKDWQSAGLQPAPDADTLTLARRLSLALAGTVPSLEELRALERQPQDRQLDWWLDRLLADQRTADYLAERWARAWVGTENGPFLVFRRRRFVLWLSDQLRNNRPYDQLVRELLTSEGLWTTHPEVNFVTASIQEGQPDPVRLAGRTARAFLALRIDCLQCHDDHLGSVRLGDPPNLRQGRQEDFHHLAAFFSGTRVSGLGVHDRPSPYRVQLLRAPAEEVLDARTPYLVDQLPSQGSLRSRLADWVTGRHNRPFARAVVNRVWALLFGKPLVEPVDDIPLAGPFPPGLESLSEDFIQHGYDLHRLIRLIVHLAPFRRDSRAPFELTVEHERHGAAFPLTRLRPEQVAGAILQACSLRPVDSNAHILARLAYYRETAGFVHRFGDRGEDEFTDEGATIPQRLLLMNGDLVKQHTQPRGLANAVGQIARFAREDRRAIEAAYLAVLTRRPTDAEADYFQKQLQQHPRRARGQALEDLYWVLLNSTEFSWNH